MIFLKYVARFCGKLWTISEEKMKYVQADRFKVKVTGKIKGKLKISPLKPVQSKSYGQI